MTLQSNTLNSLLNRKAKIVATKHVVKIVPIKTAADEYEYRNHPINGYDNRRYALVDTKKEVEFYCTLESFNNTNNEYTIKSVTFDE